MLKNATQNQHIADLSRLGGVGRPVALQAASVDEQDAAVGREIARLDVLAQAVIGFACVHRV